MEMSRIKKCSPCPDMALCHRNYTCSLLPYKKTENNAMKVFQRSTAQAHADRLMNGTALARSIFYLPPPAK
jgi:hypothetical protein